MAVGENMILNMWRLNAAAISIERLLDNILKEIKNDNSDKIQFGYNGKCDNLVYNMSYLTTIVHPLIIIRLLEHRLFTPLIKKTMTDPRGAASSVNPSISLSMSGNTPSNIFCLASKQAPPPSPLPAKPTQYGQYGAKITSSTSFPHQMSSNELPVHQAVRKCSDTMCARINERTGEAAAEPLYFKPRCVPAENENVYVTSVEANETNKPDSLARSDLEVNHAEGFEQKTAQTSQ